MAINEYNTYLNNYGTFTALKEPKSSEAIIKHSNPHQVNSKQ
jgi:hypothetical protein